jgi:hypothetical protein|nr:MAG TPA: hypothetical protein [Caudoviricetes sp.]
MAITEEERKKILNQNFPDTVLGYKRPGDVPTDFPYSEHFPQFIAKDEVIYTLTNLITRQLLSNDKYIKTLLETGDKELLALINAINNRLASNDLATVTPSYKGLMSAADKKKLDGIADRANNYVHPNSGVKAGSYKQVSVNAQGHVTGGSNPNTLQGYGIIDAAPLVHGNHVPKLESANNSRFLRNDNTWQTVTPGNIGAPTKGGTGASGTWGINIRGKANTAGTADYAANSDKLDGYHYQDIIKQIPSINYGKKQPTMTPLVDWDATSKARGYTGDLYDTVSVIRNGVTVSERVPKCKDNRNFDTGLFGLDTGDIYLKQDFRQFDTIVVIFSSDSCNMAYYQEWNSWSLDWMLSQYALINLIHSTPYWKIYGYKQQGRLNKKRSTPTFFALDNEDDSIIEIYGIKY